MRLIVEDLAAERGGRRVFSEIDFTVGSGEMLVVLGPNGAGKSTLLRVLAGLLRPAGGRVTVDPEPDGGSGGAIHYLGHLDALKPGLTVSENLRFWQRLYGGDGDVEEAADRVGLENLSDIPAGRLSAGQKRRVALARLLVSERPIWLLDEPATALDVSAEAMLGDLIMRHLAGGGLAVAATHRPLPLAPTATLGLGPST